MLPQNGGPQGSCKSQEPKWQLPKLPPLTEKIVFLTMPWGVDIQARDARGEKRAVGVVVSSFFYCF